MVPASLYRQANELLADEQTEKTLAASTKVGKAKGKKGKGRR